MMGCHDLPPGPFNELQQLYLEDLVDDGKEER